MDVKDKRGDDEGRNDREGMTREGTQGTTNT
jgi:hypothetical protein